MIYKEAKKAIRYILRGIISIKNCETNSSVKGY